MFSLDGNQMYVWYKIFTVISLDKTFPFLSDTGFPVQGRYKEIQTISRNFVKELFDNQLRLYERNRPSKLAENLFAGVYHLLITQIGKDDTNKFCQWGNELKLDSIVETKLLKWWSDLTKKMKAVDKSEPAFFTIRMLVTRYNNYLNAIRSAIDYAEDIPQNEWEKWAYEIYNTGDDRRVLRVKLVMSPLEFLEGMIEYYMLARLFYSIQTSSEIKDALSRLEIHQIFDEISDLMKLE